jgi:hypothetical protein
VALRVLVTGSRTWTDTLAIYDTFRSWWEYHGRPENPTLVSGACPKGADALAEYVWERNGWPVERHAAQWQEHGRSAGFIRNKAMVDSKPDYCFAFIKDGSKGASHTARLAEQAGIPTLRVTEDSEFDNDNEKGLD